MYLAYFTSKGEIRVMYEAVTQVKEGVFTLPGDWDHYTPGYLEEHGYSDTRAGALRFLLQHHLDEVERARAEVDMQRELVYKIEKELEQEEV